MIVCKKDCFVIFFQKFGNVAISKVMLFMCCGASLYNFITFFLFGFFNSLFCCCKSFFSQIRDLQILLLYFSILVTLPCWSSNPAKQRFFVASANFKSWFCSRWLSKLLIRNRLIYSKPVNLFKAGWSGLSVETWLGMK